MTLNSLLNNHLRVHIRRAISHSHMTYAETVPSWFLLDSKVSKLRETYYRFYASFYPSRIRKKPS